MRREIARRRNARATSGGSARIAEPSPSVPFREGRAVMSRERPSSRHASGPSCGTWRITSSSPKPRACSAGTTSHSIEESSPANARISRSVQPLRRQTTARPSDISHRSPNVTGTPRGLRREAALRTVPETFLRRTGAGAPHAFRDVEAAMDEPAASRALGRLEGDGLEGAFLLMAGSIPWIQAECNYGADNFILPGAGRLRGQCGV